MGLSCTKNVNDPFLTSQDSNNQIERQTQNILLPNSLVSWCSDLVRVNACWTQGLRKSMEDRFLIHQGICGHPEWVLLGVFDGHSGSHVSDLASKNIVSFIEHNGQFNDNLISTNRAFQKAFLDFDRSMRGKFDHGGSTAIMCLVTPENIYGINCGDSRAILCRGKEQIPLSSDHKPNKATETKRIENAGGILIFDSRQHCRIVSPSGTMSIAVSRALGDFSYKQRFDLSAVEQIVSASPETMLKSRDNLDHFIVLASDGIWDVMSNSEMAQLLNDWREEGLLVEEMSEQLIDICLSRHSADNMTIVIAEMNIPSGKYANDPRDAFFHHQKSMADSIKFKKSLSTSNVSSSKKLNPSASCSDDTSCDINNQGTLSDLKNEIISKDPKDSIDSNIDLSNDIEILCTNCINEEIDIAKPLEVQNSNIEHHMVINNNLEPEKIILTHYEELESTLQKNLQTVLSSVDLLSEDELVIEYNNPTATEMTTNEKNCEEEDGAVVEEEEVKQRRQEQQENKEKNENLNQFSGDEVEEKHETIHKEDKKVEPHLIDDEKGVESDNNTTKKKTLNFSNKDIDEDEKEAIEKVLRFLPKPNKLAVELSANLVKKTNELLKNSSNEEESSSINNLVNNEPKLTNKKVYFENHKDFVSQYEPNRLQQTQKNATNYSNPSLPIKRQNKISQSNRLKNMLLQKSTDVFKVKEIGKSRKFQSNGTITSSPSSSPSPSPSLSTSNDETFDDYFYDFQQIDVNNQTSNKIFNSNNFSHNSDSSEFDVHSDSRMYEISRHKRTKRIIENNILQNHDDFLGTYKSNTILMGHDGQNEQNNVSEFSSVPIVRSNTKRINKRRFRLSSPIRPSPLNETFFSTTQSPNDLLVGRLTSGYQSETEILPSDNENKTFLSKLRLSPKFSDQKLERNIEKKLHNENSDDGYNYNDTIEEEEEEEEKEMKGSSVFLHDVYLTQLKEIEP